MYSIFVFSYHRRDFTQPHLDIAAPAGEAAHPAPRGTLTIIDPKQRQVRRVQSAHAPVNSQTRPKNAVAREHARWALVAPRAARRRKAEQAQECAQHDAREVDVQRGVEPCRSGLLSQYSHEHRQGAH